MKGKFSIFAKQISFLNVPDVYYYINNSEILQQDVIELSHQHIMSVSHVAHQIHPQTRKYCFLLICCVPLVQQSSYVETTLEIVSSYIFYQNFLFTHIWHTLKSNLSNFSKYAIFPADLLFFYYFRFVPRVHIETPMSRLLLKTFGTILTLASEQHLIPWQAYLKNQSKHKIFFL